MHAGKNGQHMSKVVVSKIGIGYLLNLFKVFFSHNLNLFLQQEIKAAIQNNPDSVHLDVDHDPIAQVYGPEGKGRVRSMGAGVTKSSLSTSAPARELLRHEKKRSAAYEERFTNQDQRIRNLEEKIVEQAKMQAQLIAQLQRQQSGSITNHKRFLSDSITSQVW